MKPLEVEAEFVPFSGAEAEGEWGGRGSEDDEARASKCFGGGGTSLAALDSTLPHGFSLRNRQRLTNYVAHLITTLVPPCP